MIKLTNLSKIYRTDEIETVALENVNMEVAKGEFLSVMGPSGCGKSTLLNVMGLLDTPTTGTVEIAGINTTEMKRDKDLAAFRNRKLGFVFQSFHLINSLNVLDNVELPLLYRKVGSTERRRLATEVLERVGLTHRMRHFPTQLSGGQCQRVAIARALALNPKILFFDEPTSALDPELTAEVLKVIRSLADLNIAMVIVTHEMAFARDISHRVIFMEGGVIVEEGTPEKVFASDNERMRSFLGRYGEIL